MATRVRLEALTRSGLDARLARLGRGTLTRAGGVTYLETPKPFADASRLLALAGVRVTPCADVPAPNVGQRPAVALDLAALSDTADILDVVELRTVSLGEALGELSRRRPPFFGGSHAARTSCRRLLREEDEVLAWRRLIWCSFASLRSARSSVHLRPIVFDQAALQRQTLRWTYVSARAVERWAFA